ncbi:MAG TPA: hypothetical protein VIJ94_17130 [Caulobacteraceae bacterium]
MNDQAAPQVQRTGQLSWRRLHYVTWLLIIATIVRLIADTVFATVSLKSYALAYLGGAPPPGSHGQLALTLASIVYTYSSSIGFVAAAAAVEYLYRIWDCVRRAVASPAP